MFVRAKRSGSYEYLQVVHNERVDGRVRQRVIATLGRVDVLRETGQIDALLASCARFAQHTAAIDAQRQGSVSAESVCIGPALVFDRLWRQLGLPQLFERLLADRGFQFPVERAVFLTVLHRLFDSGSDRAAEAWRFGYAIEGVSQLQLPHLYRAMAWLGTPLPDRQQAHATPFASRCNKDLIEEAPFQGRRDLFSGLDQVFFDTTSIYFEGRGGQTLGRYGHSKDHPPDRKQMVVGAILDGTGRALCSELWPGNTSDARTCVPVVDRLKHRFGISGLCIVADRGRCPRERYGQLSIALAIPIARRHHRVDQVVRGAAAAQGSREVVLIVELAVLHLDGRIGRPRPRSRLLDAARDAADVDSGRYRARHESAADVTG